MKEKARALQKKQASPSKAANSQASKPASHAQIVQRKLRAHALQQSVASEALQFLKGKGKSGGSVHKTALSGVRGTGQKLPHLEKIQSSFGKHDVSGVKAFIGGSAKRAAESIGAEAYTIGERIAFREAPSLHIAAHEAAHVIHQRQGANPTGGVGEAGDVWEKHADKVADLVVSSQSAESLLSDGASAAQRGPATEAVQREELTEDLETDSTESESIESESTDDNDGFDYSEEQTPEENQSTFAPEDAVSLPEETQESTAEMHVDDERLDSLEAQGFAPDECENAFADEREWIKKWIEELQAFVEPMWAARRESGEFKIGPEIESFLGSHYDKGLDLGDIDNNHHPLANNDGTEVKGASKAFNTGTIHSERLIKKIVSGTTLARYIQEIEYMNRGVLVAGRRGPMKQYMELFGLKALTPNKHIYSLEVQGGASWGSDLHNPTAMKLKKLKLRLGTSVDFKVERLLVKYRNDVVGVSWTKPIVCQNLVVSLGIGADIGDLLPKDELASPGAIPGVADKLGGLDIALPNIGQFNTPSDDTIVKKYIPPSGFQDVDVSKASGPSVTSGIIGYDEIEIVKLFGDNGTEISFDFSGLSLSTPGLPGATLVSATNGICFDDNLTGGDQYNIKPVEDLPDPDVDLGQEWAPYASITVYFDPGSYDISDLEKKWIRRMAQDIESRGESFGSEFWVDIVGKSSSRWRQCRASDVGGREGQYACTVRMNEKLADDRAAQARSLFGGLDIKNVVSSSLVQYGNTSPDGPNSSDWRAVDINVYWKPCGE